MAQANERGDLLRKLQEYRKAIFEIRTKLNDISKKRESAFKEGQKLSAKISSVLPTIKHAKTERDQLTGEVKKSKEKREELNEEIKKRVEQIKALQREKNATLRNNKIQGDPSRILKEIERLEFIIETEAPSPSEEKQIMQRIKEKKKEYEGAKKVSDVFERIHTISKELDELRKKSDEAHKQVRIKANDSQECHGDLIESSQELNDLRSKEKEAFENFQVYRALCNDLNRQLKEKLHEIAGIQGKLDGIAEEHRGERRQVINSIIRAKQAEVEKKIAKRQKLTTEDLITMQGSI